MKIKATLLAGAALLGFMLTMPTSARADFGTATILAQNVINGTITDGSWHVTVSDSGPGNVWSIHVVANTADIPSDFIEHLQIAFYNSPFDAQVAGTALQIISVSDLSNGVLTPGGPWTGGVQVGGQSGGIGVNKQFNSDGTLAQRLMADGSNVWDGTVTVTTSADIKSVAIRLDDTTVSWRGSANVVPEVSSLALLLPGLAPLGLILRKRQRSRT